MVKVKYIGIYKQIFNKKEERIKAKTLGELIDKIQIKHKDKPLAKTIKYSSMIHYNNKRLLSAHNDLEFKLKPKDEILFNMYIAGG